MHYAKDSIFSFKFCPTLLSSHFRSSGTLMIVKWAYFSPQGIVICYPFASPDHKCSCGIRYLKMACGVMISQLTFGVFSTKRLADGNSRNRHIRVPTYRPLTGLKYICELIDCPITW